MAGPHRVAVRIVLSEERVGASGARLTGKRPAHQAGDVHAGRVGGDGQCCCVGAGPELAGPQDHAVEVVLPDERVRAPLECLAGEGAARRAGDVHPGRVDGEAGGIVVPARPELLGPGHVGHVAVDVVPPNEGVHAAQARLAQDRAFGAACDVGAGPVAGDGEGGVEVGRAELPGEQEGAVDVVLLDVRVHAAPAHTPLEATARMARDGHAGSIRRNGVGVVEAVRGDRPSGARALGARAGRALGAPAG